MKQKVVLAFSGGLDTSFCVPYLIHKRNLEVHTVIVNTGGFSEDELNGIEERAKTLGAAP
jgi:argininosuccinate synthase